MIQDFKQQFWFVFTIIETVIIVGLVITCIYWMIRYHMLSKNEECCQNRPSMIVNIFMLIATIERIPVNFIAVFSDNIEPTGYKLIIALILDHIAPICVVAVVVNYAHHMFDLHYEIQLSRATQKQEWKRLIDNKKTDNWYILNKHKWGNKSFTKKVFYTYTILQIFIPMGLNITQIILGLNPETKKLSVIINGITLVSFLTLLCPVILIVVLYKRVKSFDDVFLIIKQARYNAYLILFHVIIWVIIRVCYEVFEGRILICELLFSGLLYLSYWWSFPCFVLVNTYWVIKNVIHKQSRDKSVDNIKSIRVRTVLANEDATDIFMKHLADGMFIYTVHVAIYCLYIHVYRIIHGNAISIFGI